MKKTSGRYSNNSNSSYHPGKNIPDRVVIDDKVLSVLTEAPVFDYLPRILIEPLAGQKERGWFTEHFYFCLPVTFGNQHGFIIKLLYDLVARWDGGVDKSAVIIHRFCTEDIKEHQIISSHFGSGIITIQNRWTFRTQAGMNLIVGAPPNFLLPGITPMFAVVQTDQLRRDFTLNLKINIANRDVYLPKGTPVGWVLPYPRSVIQDFKTELFPEGPILEEERETMQHFGISRRNYEKGLPGHHYRKGIDIYGNKFPEHERVVSGLTPSQWRGDAAWPVVEMGSDPNSNQLDTYSTQDEARIHRALEKLKQLNPSTRREHVVRAYLYISSERNRGQTDEEIIGILSETGWSKASLDALFQEL